MKHSVTNMVTMLKLLVIVCLSLCALFAGTAEGQGGGGSAPGPGGGGKPGAPAEPDCDPPRPKSICLTCHNAASDADCEANGEYKECPMSTPVCEYEVHENTMGQVFQVRRMCKQSNACDARSHQKDGHCRGGTSGQNKICTWCTPTLTTEPCPENCTDQGALACLTCNNAASDEDCEKNGEVKVCKMSRPVCEYEYHNNTQGGVHQIRRGCLQENACWAKTKAGHCRGSNGGAPNEICTWCDSAITTGKCPECVYKNVVFQLGQEITNHDKSDCEICICTAAGIDCSPRPGAKKDGKWSIWVVSSACNKPCGSGAEYLSRQCSTPPECGGNPCQGPKFKSRLCNVQKCPPDCTFNNKDYNVGEEVPEHPNHNQCVCCICTAAGINCSPRPGAKEDAVWSVWGPLGGCSKTCGSGVQQLTRTCSDPKCGGRVKCLGSSISDEQCNTQPCPQTTTTEEPDAPDMCKCRVRGDPIVETFDDNWGLIDGAGEYIVARSRRPGCEWILTITVARVNGRWVIVKVTLYYRGKTYSGGDSGLEVDGVPTTIPFDDGNMKVNPNPGGMIGEIDQCKVVFMVNGANLRKTLTVIMRDPPMYVGYVDGMCGFCNGNPDDDVLLKNGDPIGTDEFRFKRWGQSWQKP